MDLLNETVPLKIKSTFFNLLIRETSQFLCYERLLNMTYVAYKNAFFREMQFWSHCYTVVSYQALFRLSVYKIPAVYLSGAKNVYFCTIRDFGSPTNMHHLKELTFTLKMMLIFLSSLCCCDLSSKDIRLILKQRFCITTGDCLAANLRDRILVSIRLRFEHDFCITIVDNKVYPS